MDDVIIARALHVLAVVIWIGGVPMVTMAVLPAVRPGDVGPNRLRVLEAIERRFVWHARIATVIVALTGLTRCITCRCSNRRLALSTRQRRWSAGTYLRNLPRCGA